VTAMARRGSSGGLSIGAVLTLTLGFLVASLLIFVFGIWVGKDMVERRLAQEERVVRKHVDTMQGEGTEGHEAAPGPGGAQPRQAPALAPAVPVVAAATPTTAPVAAASPTRMEIVVPYTPTRRVEVRPTATPEAKAGPERRSVEEWADAGWTVQVYATTDPKEATSFARRLLAKGYDAYTLQAPLRGQTWYRVRVGRFAKREKAEEMEKRLKRLEGLEAAYVTAQ